MTNSLSQRLGLTLGSFAALLHAAWSVLVWLGFAQLWADFAMRMHGFEPMMHVTGLTLLRAVCLVGLAFVIGYVVGAVLGMIYEKMGKS